MSIIFHRPRSVQGLIKIEECHLGLLGLLVSDGIIRPSMSQWNAPLLVVSKKTDASRKQKLRIVIDFRKLSDLTIGDSFPLPNITDILD